MGLALKNSYFLGLIVVLFVGGCLRFIALTSQSLWSDETFIIYYILHDFASGLKFLWFNDNSPPLYVILLKGWSYLFGVSEFSFRFFSALVGTFSIYWFYRLVELLKGARFALIGASLLAISPLGLYYSQEVRYYALWLLLSNISFYYFFKKSYFLWAVATILALYTHIFTLFILFIQLFLFVKKAIDDRSFSFVKKLPDRFWFSSSLMLFCSLPIIWWVYLHTGKEAGFIKPFSLFHFPYVPFAWVLGYSFGPSVRELHYMSATDVLSGYGLSVFFPMLIILTIVFAGIKEGMKERGVRNIIWISIFTLCLVVMTPLFSNITFNVRSTLFLLPFFYMILAMGIDKLWQGRYRLVPVAMLSLMVFSLFQYYTNTKYARDDVRSVSKLISKELDVPVLTSYMLKKYVFSIYYDNDLQTYKLHSFEAINELKDEKKLWLIWNRMWMYKDAALFKDYFQKNYRVISENSFPGIDVQLVERMPKY